MNEVFLESMIQSNILMDVDLVVIKPILDLLSESDPSIDRFSYVSIVESLEYPIEQQVNDPTEFNPSCRILTLVMLSLSLQTLLAMLNLSFLLRLILLIINPCSLEL